MTGGLEAERECMPERIRVEIRVRVRVIVSGLGLGFIGAWSPRGSRYRGRLRVGVRPRVRV